MKSIYLLVEGQTEETFVNELLVPHYAAQGIFLTPIIVSTSKNNKGGVVSYAKIKPQIIRLCNQRADAYVSTMFDLYALPTDFPGKASAAYPYNGTGAQKALYLEDALQTDINSTNFIPHLLVHEFEALLFSKVDAFELWTDKKTLLDLRQIASNHEPEDINDHPSTAPSKRILSKMPNYRKTLHGPLIACDIGLATIRQHCPHFAAWLGKIEALLE